MTGVRKVTENIVERFSETSENEIMIKIDNVKKQYRLGTIGAELCGAIFNRGGQKYAEKKTRTQKSAQKSIRKTKSSWRLTG